MTGQPRTGEPRTRGATRRQPPNSQPMVGEGTPLPVEHLDVLIVGAGLSGVGTAHYVKTHCPWARFAVFEARDAIGGTWDLFRFPGIRSDSDMYTLGYAFRPWEGERTIAQGADIRDYIRETARLSGIEDRIRFRHRVVSAEWSTEDARWQITAVRESVGGTAGTSHATDTADRGDAAVGETLRLTAAFLFSCSGYYRYDRGHLPEFPGRERFEGAVVHPQFWPEDLDYEGKRVVVIGSGATAFTVIPALAEKADHVTMLQRSPSYVASLPTVHPLSRFARRILPAPAANRLSRWLLACLAQAFYAASRRWPERTRRALIGGVRRELPEGFDVDTHFSPRYNPWDQRLCIVPDGDMFAAIRAGKVSVVTDRIRTFTEHGVLLESGTEIPADVIVTATGLELQFAGGIHISVDGVDVDPAERLVYKGAMLEGVPNFAFAFGYTNASWTLKCDLTCQFVVRLLNEMRSAGMRQCTPVNTDPSVEREPFVDLTSGYVLRAADRLPKRGSRFPWQVHQNYLRDYQLMKMRPIVDESLVFSNPGSLTSVQLAGPITHTHAPASSVARGDHHLSRLDPVAAADGPN